jgi:hypothetical protein
MKKLTMFGAIVGSCAGSYIPVLWGGSLLSMSSLLLATVGALRVFGSDTRLRFGWISKVDTEQ